MFLQESFGLLYVMKEKKKIRDFEVTVEAGKDTTVTLPPFKPKEKKIFISS